MQSAGMNRIRGLRPQRRGVEWWAFGLMLGLGVTSCGLDAGESSSSEEITPTTGAVTSQAISGEWTCPNNLPCQDVYEIDIATPSQMTITASSSNATLRLGVFAPIPNPGGGTNVLTGTALDRRCATGPSTDQLTFRAMVAGRYRFTFGRDPAGSSLDGKGNYTATVSTNGSLTFIGRTQNDVTTTSNTGCKYMKVLSGAWNNCTNGCQDRYDLEVRPGTELKFFSEVHNGSVVRLAAFGQLTPPSGVNLLTGENKDRQCTAQGVHDSVTFIGSSGGIYHFAIGRAAGGSTGNLKYLAGIESSDTSFIPIFWGQSAEDVPTQAVGTRCGFGYTLNGTLSCSAFTDCQNTYDFNLPTTTPVDISVTNVTGGAAVQLAVVGTPVTTNLLNGRTTNRRCATVNGNDFVTLSATSGRRRLSIGRIGGAVVTTGTFRLDVSTPDVVIYPLGQTAAGQPLYFGPGSCP